MKKRELLTTPFLFVGAVLGAGVLLGVVISITAAVVFGLHVAAQYLFGPF